MEAIILTARAADHGSIRAVLSEWGYRESEIQRLLMQDHTFTPKELGSSSAGLRFGNLGKSDGGMNNEGLRLEGDRN